MEEKIATDNEAVPEKPPQQVFCEKCGALITQDTEICPNCGCPTKPDRQATAIDNTQSVATNTINKIKSVAAKAIDKMKSVGIKRIATIAVSVVTVIAVIVVGLLVRNNIRVNKVKEQLAGNTFDYISSYWFCSYSFDEKANCTCSFYDHFSNDIREYECEYKIKFKNGMVFFDLMSETFEIQYDKYGNIEGLYNIGSKQFYD